MKLFVPELGTELKLIKDWSFDLYSESRNSTLGETLGYNLEYKSRTYPSWIPYVKGDPIPDGYVVFGGTRLCKQYVSTDYHWWVKDGEQDTHTIPVVLPVGTILKVDRIYIRKGAKDFSSISFYITSKEKIKRTGKSIRFWAKLTDCNNIEFE